MAVCGAGVGTVLFAPINEALIKVSWRTVFAVYTGGLWFILNNLDHPTKKCNFVPHFSFIPFYAFAVTDYFRHFFCSKVILTSFTVIVLMCSLCGATFRPFTFVAVEDEGRKKKVLNGDEKNRSVEMVHKNFILISFLFVYTLTSCRIKHSGNLYEMLLSSV